MLQALLESDHPIRGQSTVLIQYIKNVAGIAGIGSSDSRTIHGFKQEVFRTIRIFKWPIEMAYVNGLNGLKWPMLTRSMITAAPLRCPNNLRHCQQQSKRVNLPSRNPVSKKSELRFIGIFFYIRLQYITACLSNPIT